MSFAPVLRSIRLRNYKGFRDHTISLRVGVNILVGANNAGKSTALGALRLIAAMLPTARRLNPSRTGLLGGQTLRGWPVTAAALEASAFALENIRYDFRPDETTIEVLTTQRAKLVVAWEEDYDGNGVIPMYYVIPPAGTYITPREAARDLTPDIAILPTFTPVEDREPHVTDETIRRNLTSRRASRYFRNSLLRLESDSWRLFKEFALLHTPEMGDLEIRHASETADNDLDLFYVEPETRHLREIVWAGDGMQIWLQILFHYWRQRECPVVLLDEPDIFLHPDLQRRLARTIFPEQRQVILATHSTEILAEAEPGSALWVDRSRRTAERPRSDGAISLIGRRLGSGYELGVARALRSSTVLFIEGDDAPILAQMARALGFDSVSLAESYATVPLGGFSRRDLAAAFSETVGALGGDVRTVVLLDGDLRSFQATQDEVALLRKSAALVHVWQRREIENYLLQPGAISAVSGLALDEAAELLERNLEINKSEALLTLNSARLIEGHGKGLAHKTILKMASAEFEDLWAAPEGRVSVVDPKQVLKGMNSELQQASMKTVSALSLARNMAADQAPGEIRRFLQAFAAVIDRS